ncbi:MAG: tRNA (N(6)-L-threonylcarbamoyladenosine(37)-C(2))-methylthiotransferase MtaB [Candidatus Abyssobacteria bacterium SURF_5]|uniref:tRNA (N(6)-L-threonylcarbamoyladenosine(37)-C(2))-methylthiotransferase MtaB n=1 Tax=Abyssobacteria bacterium (strain SURF_5) TaxID=2093360 RepID=A0A3A4NX33_ABYX5|nr:MAG: tRNA (N(6)-L-threonylcarbamoyladenosine(37)-C(2))-methylthiotransferase MtaB [Candidatus Abyssubacteria bacterium SURF_5]
MSSFRILTFGCKVNQCDSQVLRETLVSWGLAESETEQCDLVIVNSCTVTGGADAKFRKALRKIRRENPGALIGLTGCFVNRVRSSNAPPSADFVFSPDSPGALAEFLRGRNLINGGILREVRQSFFAEHTRAFLKIQDGCTCFCSYCIIPFVRPTLWSREPEEVLATINELSGQGYREVVLSGIHLGFYGRQAGEAGAMREPIPLVALLSQIEVKCRIDRIRLSSIEINEVTDELIEFMAGSKKLCRHLHLPLQSGSDRILQKMNRRYAAGFYAERISRIKEKLPDIGLTTDIIVGFPGESEEDFRQTCEAVERVGFVKIHVFRYSNRPGTSAASFRPQVPSNVTSERARRLIRVGNDTAARYKRRFMGKTLPVLIEAYDRRGGFCRGLTPNYMRVRLEAGGDYINEILPVQIEEIDEVSGVALGTAVQQP